ncbi:M28 family peptidase [Anaerosoma tenue]|uniref:M28 family peptidase n=1 Tax=Anaerosoma tenue TaxID=2933588 RepID=UPI002260E8C3|nr:M28 family peptidase [Anaerosoma tenue]MCK8114141.1 M28 family metallopeptidase [Anaerosoma tenue]
MTTDALARRIARDIADLCDPGDRSPGTERNRAAVEHVSERMRECGLAVERVAFEVPEWRYGTASVDVAGLRSQLHPGPFSPRVHGTGRLAVVRTADEIPSAIAPDAVLLLCGDIALEQLTPRDYPFYIDPGHAAILDALEAVRPLAIIAATDRSAMTAAMSPFPLIEESGFGVPHAYLHVSDGASLAEHDGEQAHVRIDSETRPSEGVQIIGVRPGSRPDAGTVVVCAHIDTKPDTPGAIDNAAGVAVLLAAAHLLRDRRVGPTVEFVPFNGEDHAMAPGELAYLAVRPDLTDVRLAVNVDAAGLAGGPTAYSGYGIDSVTEVLLASLAEGFPHIAAGPSWPASDHMVFAMRGVPAVALTSSDLDAVMHDHAHTPGDVPSLLDPDILSETARFMADLIESL